MYTVFVRNFWKLNPLWPDGREPDPTARRTVIARDIETEDEARAMAQEYNRTHKPGRLSRKAEYTSQ